MHGGCLCRSCAPSLYWRTATSEKATAQAASASTSVRREKPCRCAAAATPTAVSARKNGLWQQSRVPEVHERSAGRASVQSSACGLQGSALVTFGSAPEWRQRGKAGAAKGEGVERYLRYAARRRKQRRHQGCSGEQAVGACAAGACAAAASTANSLGWHILLFRCRLDLSLHLHNFSP